MTAPKQTASQRKTATFFLFAITPTIFALAVIVIYSAHFWHSRLSAAPAWGAFGDYIGGTLGPLFAYFAFIAVLLTLITQQEALEITREEARRSREYLDRKEKRDEWQRVINHAEKQIDKQLNFRVQLSTGESATWGSFLDYVAGKIREQKKYYDSAYANILLQKAGLEVSNFTGLANLVISLGRYLDKFSDYLTETDPEILSHYVSSHQNLVSNLHIMGIISEKTFQEIFGKLLDKTCLR